MRKILHKGIVASAVIFAASLSANAQTVLIDEHFNSGAFATEQNWLSATDAPSTTGCDPASGTPQPTPATASKDVVQGTVTYTLTNAASTPSCYHKSHVLDPSTSTNPCENAALAADPEGSGDHGSIGYVVLNNGATSLGSITTSVLENVGTVDILLSATGGSDRRAELLKSTDGGTTWQSVRVMSPNDYPLKSTCGQYGINYKDIAVNEASVRLRIAVSPTGTTYNKMRLHDFVVRTQGTTSITKAAWAESGVSLAVDNSTMTLTSETLSGTVEVIGINGSVIAQKELAKGNTASVALPSSGLYVVRFTADNMMFTRKISVNY